MLRLVSRFLRALFQFSKRAAGEATKFGRSGVELLGVVGATCLECGEPAAESGELIRRQLRDNFGNFFDFHVAQYSTAGVLSENSIRLGIRVARQNHRMIGADARSPVFVWHAHRRLVQVAVPA